MGLIARPEGCPPTLGAMQTQRYQIYGHCRNPRCWREFGVDLAGLIARFGPDCFLVELAAKRIVCRSCWGLDMQWHITAPTMPAAGLTHTGYTETPRGYEPPTDKEPPLERYRRLARDAVLVTSPGEVEGIDEAERPPREYIAPSEGAHVVRRLCWHAEDGRYGWWLQWRWLTDWSEMAGANDR